jgi:ethanolamine transporter EutH
MGKKPRVASLAAAGLLAGLAVTAPAYGLGEQRPDPHASCMGWLANASNPNASGDHIAFIAQSGNASTVAHADVTGDGFPGLLSCVEQIP